MKRLFYLFFAFLFIFFTSCEKEELEDENIEVVDPYAISEEDTISIYGKFLLLSGKMYVTNLETNEKKVYNHFDAVKTTSSLRYSGSQYEIEDLTQNITTWEITPPPYVPGNGEFILNNDSLNPYGFHVTKSNWTIVEHSLTGNYGITQKMGGSSRPLYGYLLDKADSTVVFRLHEGYENIGGYNCRYVSELVFKKL